VLPHLHEDGKAEKPPLLLLRGYPRILLRLGSCPLQARGLLRLLLAPLLLGWLSMVRTHTGLKLKT
jgi:hypothetical protein